MRYLVAALVLLLPACDKECPSYDCVEQVLVIFGSEDTRTHQDVRAFHGTVAFENTAFEFQCPGSSENHYCGDGFFAVLAMPPSISVTVETDDGLLHGTLETSITYEGVAPFGDECGPECRGANLALTLE